MSWSHLFYPKPQCRIFERDSNTNETSAISTQWNALTNLHILILFNQLYTTNTFEIAVYTMQNDGPGTAFGIPITKDTGNLLSSVDGHMTSRAGIRTAALPAVYCNSVGNMSKHEYNRSS